MRRRLAGRIERDRSLSSAAIKIEVSDRCVELASRKCGLDLGGSDLDIFVNDLLSRETKLSVYGSERREVDGSVAPT